MHMAANARLFPRTCNKTLANLALLGISDEPNLCGLTQILLIIPFNDFCRHNKYIHTIDRTVMAPSTDDVHRPWTAEDQITIPYVPILHNRPAQPAASFSRASTGIPLFKSVAENCPPPTNDAQFIRPAACTPRLNCRDPTIPTLSCHCQFRIVPNWVSRHWDTAMNKRVDEITSLEAANTARMYMMAFCQELSKRLDQKGGIVKCHVFDPGMMSTRYTRKASGLGHWKTWHVWKAKR